MNNLVIVFIIASEFILGLYSVLIKTVPTTLSTQILARMLTYTLGSLVISQKSTPINPSICHLLYMGLLNIIHISSSYYAFKTLPSATALSMFYTYPFFNVLFSSIFLNEKLNFAALPWLALSFVGCLFMIFPTHGHDEINIPGLFSIIVSAITEALIYIVFRCYEPTEAEGMFHLYGGGLIATLLARGANIIEPFDFSIKTWAPLLVFNLLIGFLAYSLIFQSIPKISVELFASLAFFGVLSGFIFGEIGGEKRPSIPTYVGAVAIVASAVAIRLLKIDKA
jgi:drug/metabolite transporter (DMT)-like permease